MQTKLINIGNSKGILIPAKIIELLGLKDKVQFTVEDNKLIIEQVSGEARAVQAERFAHANSMNDDTELIPDVFEDEDFEEWKW